MDRRNSIFSIFVYSLFFLFFFFAFPIFPFPLRLMDKVGSEGDEARAMMREIRTLCLNPRVIVGGFGSNSTTETTHATHVSFTQQGNYPRNDSINNGYHGCDNDNNNDVDSNITYNNDSNSNIGDNIYDDDRRNRMSWINRTTDGEEDASLDYDRERVEGNLSMSISGSEGGRPGLDDSGFLSP